MHIFWHEKLSKKHAFSLWSTKKVIEKIVDILPKKIVYVSCNSSTLARDLVIFKKKYEISKLQTVDMFPHTSHVENVVLLKKIINV